MTTSLLDQLPPPPLEKLEKLELCQIVATIEPLCQLEVSRSFYKYYEASTKSLQDENPPPPQEKLEKLELCQIMPTIES